MGQFIEDLQYKLRTSSGSLMLMMAKIFVGLVLGLTFAMIGQEMVGYGTFSYALVLVASLAALLRVSRGWRWAHLSIFALMCVLIGLLLRMYILVAPGA